MPSRRQFVKGGVVVGTAAALGAPALLRARPAQADEPTLNPNSIPKYVTPLFIQPAMPPSLVRPDRIEYRVAQRRISAQSLPVGMPKTLVNGYGVPGLDNTFHSPGFTIENKVNKQTRVTWINQLVDSQGNFLPHLLTVDPTIHWSNPPGGLAGRDSTPTFTSTPPPYDGPQPMIVHLHGAHVTEESDGLPETWFLPLAKNIPSGFARVGSDYNQFRQEAQDRFGVSWAPGTLTSVYPNDQRAAPLWYHDHVLGMTRLDVYSGLVGFYILSGGDADVPVGTVPGPRPMPGDPRGKRYYDIVLALQDRSFNADGSLFWPSETALAGNPPDQNLIIPNGPLPPYWTSNFQGTTSTVNGNTWPVLDVEPRRYRFRILDGNNFRVYQLKIVRAGTELQRPATVALPTWVIGADGSLVPQATNLQETNQNIMMVTSERVDIIVDFTGMAGQEFIMINESVQGGANGVPATPTNNVNTVGQIMKFRVSVPLQSEDKTLPPDQLPLPPRRNIGAPKELHRVSMFSEDVVGNGQQSRFRMGTVVDPNAGVNGNSAELWEDPITHEVKNGNVAEWEVWNFSAAASGNQFLGGGHAFHIHLVEFQLTEREVLDANGRRTGQIEKPQPWETGEKDSLFAAPARITRFRAPFDLVSRYIYHCHFTDHEDHEMMRFWRVVP